MNIQRDTFLESAGGYQKPINTVGEEFVNWAEQYWRLEQHYSETASDSTTGQTENCPYSVVREAFIKKINEVVKKRVEDYF